MNLKNAFIIISLTLGLVLAISGHAQTFPDFTISTTASAPGIALDLDNPLVNKYEMDISDRDWSESQAFDIANFIDEKSELIALETDYKNKRIILILNTTTSATTSWTVKDWNIYLKSIF